MIGGRESIQFWLLSPRVTKDPRRNFVPRHRYSAPYDCILSIDKDRCCWIKRIWLIGELWGIILLNLQNEWHANNLLHFVCMDLSQGNPQ